VLRPNPNSGFCEIERQRISVDLIRLGGGTHGLEVRGGPPFECDRLFPYRVDRGSSEIRLIAILRVRKCFFERTSRNDRRAKPADGRATRSICFARRQRHGRWPSVARHNISGGFFHDKLGGGARILRCGRGVDHRSVRNPVVSRFGRAARTGGDLRGGFWSAAAQSEQRELPIIAGDAVGAPGVEQAVSGGE
jgi:hypothetical protein